MPDVYGVTTNQDTLFAITAVFVAITVAANTRVALLAELAKGGSAWDAAAVLGRQVPLWLIAAVGCAWNAIPALLAIVAVHPYLFIATLGAQFAAITSQLMVAHAAGQAYEPNVLPLAPLAVPLAAVLASRMGCVPLQYLFCYARAAPATGQFLCGIYRDFVAAFAPSA